MTTGESSGRVVEGRHVITGRVVSIREDRTGEGQRLVRMLIADDRGFRVWGVPPRVLRSFHYWRAGELRLHVGAVVGDRVQFTAFVEASVEDGSFGLFSRAFRGAVLPTQQTQANLDMQGG